VTKYATTDIEKKSLEAHVELCAERYATLDERNKIIQAKIDALGNKVEALEEHIIFIREALAGSTGKHNKQLIVIGTTIVGVLIGGIITLIVNLVKIQ
jgi:hypothetical protein